MLAKAAVLRRRRRYRFQRWLPVWIKLQMQPTRVVENPSTQPIEQHLDAEIDGESVQRRQRTASFTSKIGGRPSRIESSQQCIPGGQSIGYPSRA